MKLGASPSSSKAHTNDLALSAPRLLGRNWPLVLLLVTIGALFWPSEDGEPLDDGFEAARRPNGSDDRMPSASRH